MGKFKSIFVACLGLGIAAGAGYYLNWKYIRKDGKEDGKGSSTQVKTDRLYYPTQKKVYLNPNYLYK